jgi:hypothetical protein
MIDPRLAFRELFSHPVAILCIALVLLAVFVAALIFDPFRYRSRQRHRHRSRSRPRLTLRQRLATPFVQFRAICLTLMDLARRRARRRAREERLAEQMRRYSK